jgi:hypothetical protein
MPISSELYEKMCSFFDGELSKEEEIAFLELVAKDPELKQEFEWEEQMMFNAYPRYKEEILIAADAGIGEVEIPEKKIPRHTVPRVRNLYSNKFAVAASLFIITVIALLLVFLSRKNDDAATGIAKMDTPVFSPSKLPFVKLLPPDTTVINKTTDYAAVSWEKQMNEVNKLGLHKPDIDTESPLLGEVQQAFVNEEYANLIALADNTSQLRGVNSDSENIRRYAAFYKGIGLIQLNRDSAAIPVLQKIIRDKRTPYKIVLEAKWNIARAYYKTRKKAEALAVIEFLLAEPAFTFKKEAEKLLLMIKGRG